MPNLLIDPDRRGTAVSRVPRSRFEARLADEARFIRSWIDNPVLTGAVSPSGRFLARMMARAVNPDSSGPIVELGPGTGPITQALLSRGVDPLRLLLVEYDGAFCRLLRKRFPGVQVVQGDAYDLSRSLRGTLAAPAAAIVSSLPLLTKPDAQRLSLLDDAFSLMAPGGTFVQFTYGMTSPVPHTAALDYDAAVSPPVWLNLPPARVWIYRRKAAAPRVGLDAPGVFRPIKFKPAKFDPPKVDPPKSGSAEAEPARAAKAAGGRGGPFRRRAVALGD